MLRRIVKAMLPSRVRRSLRRLHRKVIFRRAMKRFLASPETVGQPGNRVLLDLIYGWGNEGWSAREEFLAECIDRTLTSKGPILECGSGLSTILVGAIAAKQGRSHWALEHLPSWAAKVQERLDRYGLDCVRLSVSPLLDYGEFHWYDPPLDAMPAQFELVICDGPPGGVKGGRYGLVPVMRDRLTAGCTVLLDDVVREEEHTIARRWSTELAGIVETGGVRKPYGRLTVPTNRLQRLA